MFTESLTVRLLGDSSQLQGELESVAERVEELAGRLSAVQGGFDRAGRSASSLGAAVAPLQNVARAIDQVQGKLDQLSRTSVSLNVSPALNALAMLSQAVSQVASQLASLFITAAPISGGGGEPTGMRFASGGLVTGPGGIDRVPALLTAGEYVLQASAVERLGIGFLEAINQSGWKPGRVARGESVSGSGTVTNHFGGITIQVEQVGRLDEVLDTVMSEESRLRARRG